jgi:hypothetical protein
MVVLCFLAGFNESFEKNGFGDLVKHYIEKAMPRAEAKKGCSQIALGSTLHFHLASHYGTLGGI